MEKRVGVVVVVVVAVLLSISACDMMPDDQRRQQYVDEHPELDDQVREYILQGKVAIGMTAEQCLASWGKPNTVNTTANQYGRHEQWVYPSTYLYFDDGILTSWSQ